MKQKGYLQIVKLGIINKKVGQLFKINCWTVENLRKNSVMYHSY